MPVTSNVIRRRLHNDDARDAGRRFPSRDGSASSCLPGRRPNPAAAQGIDTAQGVGQPVWAGHVLHQARSIGDRNAGGGDVERCGTSTPHLGCMRGSAKHSLGDADHGHAELSVGVRAQTRPALTIEVDVPVDDQQTHRGGTGHDRTDRRQFPEVEGAGPVVGDVGQRGGVLLCHHGERRVGRHDESGERATCGWVVNVHRCEPGCLHDLIVPYAPRPGAGMSARSADLRWDGE